MKNKPHLVARETLYQHLVALAEQKTSSPEEIHAVELLIGDGDITALEQIDSMLNHRCGTINF